MAHVRVSVIRTSPGMPYFYPGDRSGEPLRFPIYRLLVTLALPAWHDLGDPLGSLPDVIRVPAILDTGAPVSIFPFATWECFTDRIRWLDQPSPTAPRRVAILGGSFAYRLGRLRVGLADAEQRWLPPVLITGVFLDDVPGAPREAILGLRSRLLERWQLRHEPIPGADPDTHPGRWWLEDAT